MTLVIGTAGHIDHGKTTLLRALTGIDADRLPEERARGMTIDVGYAHMRLPDGREVDFVDVPGHDRLVGNMLVGAGEVDACLLVVAADDGPSEQTLEHLELLDALGIEHGLVALTKVDMVDADRVSEVRVLTTDLVAATRLAGSLLIEVSALDGQGLESLRLAIAGLADRVSARGAVWRETAPRLAIDRVFTVRGRGVVVTGSMVGSGPRVGDALEVQPGGGRVRVRGIEVHGRAVERAPSGGRVALNLAGPPASALVRGNVLVSETASGAGRPVASDRLLVILQPPAALRRGGRPARWPISERTHARLHLGTDQLEALVMRATGRQTALADGSTPAMLRLERAVATGPGDHFVLRQPPPSGLLAGGVVLDARPSRGASRRRLEPERLARLAGALAAHPPDAAAVAAARLELHGVVADGAEVHLAADVRVALEAAVLAAVAEHHSRHPDRSGMPGTALRAVAWRAARRLASVSRERLDDLGADLLEELVAAGRLVREADRHRLPAHRPAAPDPGLAAAMDRLVALLDADMPPALPVAARQAGCSPEGVRQLERSGRIVVLDDDVAWSREQHARLEARARALAADGPLTPARLRDETGTSRRYVMALLEDLGRRGVLRRTPEGHVPGPRG